MDESDSEQESESVSTFQQMLKNKLRKGLAPTTTKLTLPDGSVQLLEQRGSSTCKNVDAALLTSTYGFVVDNKPDLSISCVLEDWLFISSQDVANDLNLILNHKITYILSLLPEFKLIPEVQAVICEHLCLDYYDDISFSITNIEVFSPALEFIHKAKIRNNGKILVHCNAGVSRSPTIVILYLMKYEHFSFDEAFKIIKCVRPKIKPNDGFLKQLKEYNKLINN